MVIAKIIDKNMSDLLISLFDDFQQSGVEKYFHPHPLTKEQAKIISYYLGKDLYYLFFNDENLIGYGFLRGWDKGYTVPSLGIALRQSARGKGFARLCMLQLHYAAKKKGAKQVILKVYPDNVRALNLYIKLGYQFTGMHDGQLVGLINL